MLIGECCICFDDLDSRTGNCLGCGHFFHAHCIIQWFEVKTNQNCPICRTPHLGNPIRLYLNDDNGEDEMTDAAKPKETEKHKDKQNDKTPTMAPLKKKNVRCVFWPNCKRGKSCQFVHPQEKCKAYAEKKCFRGDTCCYFHPQCKIGNKCDNQQCNLSHVVRKMTKTDNENPELTRCTFNKMCRNKDCPKIHPKKCKFDLFCTNKTCTQWHPLKNNKGHNDVQKKAATANKFS